MLENSYISLILQILSCLLLLIFGVAITRLKNKQQLHYAFLAVIWSLVYWSTIRLAQFILYEFYGRLYPLLEDFLYVGICVLPSAMLLAGIIFYKTKIHFNWKYKLLFVVPALSVMIALTNPLHHLFIVEYSFINTEYVYGPYYVFHEFYSYGCILIGLFHLLFFSIKNAGFFSKQSMLILAGELLPVAVVILSTQKIIVMPVFVENISFSFAIVCFSIALFKFEFLSIAPIALQKIVDLISDSYVVINRNMEIVDYNQTFVNTFRGLVAIHRRQSLLELLTKININVPKVLAHYETATAQKGSVRFEEHIQQESFEGYFEIELIPVFSDGELVGAILLFKNISEYKRNIETIKRNQEIILEQERMVSLGQMIGGIAHNLKTPIMSISGGIEGLSDLVREYRDSVGDESVTPEDHREIAAEMMGWLDKMRPYCTYMSDVISAVKGQAVQMNDSSTSSFTIEELVKRVDLLMKHELKKYHCVLRTDFRVNLKTEIKGELNNLVQIFDNIIMNAIQSYEGETGEVFFQIVGSADTIQFSVRDQGKGIPEQVKHRLFREMVTTKGKNGTGLGLYMSYSTIKGRFGGDLWFTSAEGEGTTVYIAIPHLDRAATTGGKKDEERTEQALFRL